MSFNSRQLNVGVDRAFATISDPTTYPHWLVGAQAIRDVDDDWPQPGSRFRHLVGVGLLQFPDNSEVLEIEPGYRLRLKVKARPLITAVATFTVVGDEHRCVVSIEEEPTPRTLGTVVRVVMDPTVHVRNHRSLARLAAFVEST
ncbi:MAG: SRPBCC family protein [Ilumatobacteraceae bacterium]